jgi:hypothetical protein
VPGDDLDDATELLAELGPAIKALSAWLRVNRGNGQFWNICSPSLETQ